MIGNDILAILDQLAATGSRTDKEAILAKHSHDPLLRKVLTYAYDPFRTYGIKKLPTVAQNGNKTLDENSPAWSALDALCQRTVAGARAEKLVSDWLGLLDEDSAQVFSRVLLKDLRCGISEKTINGVIPGLVPNFTCMLAKKYEAKRINAWPVRADIKEDGFRVLAFVQIGRTGADGTVYDERVGFFSRSGKPYTTMDHLKAPLLAAVKNLCDDWAKRVLPSSANDNATLGTYRVVIESEVVSNSFAETSSELRKKDNQAADAVMKVFDILPMELFEGEDVTAPELGGYEVRRKLVGELIRRVPPGAKVEIMPSYLCNSEDEIMAVYERVRARGKEGVIVKPLDGCYERKRSFGWLKIKAELSVDIPVLEAFEGTGKYEGQLGGLICDYKGVRVRVGGGFSDEQRRELWAAWNRDQRIVESWGAAGTTELVGRLIEVEFHEETPDGSLRHPRFVRFRDDKPACDGPGAEAEREAA